MITYRRMTFSFKDGFVLVSGWFLFNRWAILRYRTHEEPTGDADADAR